MQLNTLTEEEKKIILEKNTEPPFTGKYDNFFRDGIYLCRQCNQPLFDAKAKFEAGCGWPSFEDTYPNAVEEVPDPNGSRTEIICSRCKGHLGHVFRGEQLTEKDVRHCVNSLSIKFISRELISKYEQE